MRQTIREDLIELRVQGGVPPGRKVFPICMQHPASLPNGVAVENSGTGSKYFDCYWPTSVNRGLRFSSLREPAPYEKA